MVWLLVALLLLAAVAAVVVSRRSSAGGERHVPPEYAVPGRCVVVLGNPGPRPAETLATIRETTGVGLRQARDWLAEAPCAIAGGLGADSAERVRARLEQAGASAWVEGA